ncbi:MAG TPA: hypothetical protein DEB61_00830 [Alcanivorax sp.]|nr:hypothetical protein [Alcanivorax sp.]HAD46388.1 hypothetical protein [Alcanivorax sp.]HAI35582.1 hypothetical protein [Alcanivorax sp.]HAI90196.1 hypothetical protein [Alcanivorax sp.]HBP69201.1 hypothetical protein [Alcanivorax sp.]|tara:strand:- start:3295 stop:4545 length:1251 start_codon:yes stop_codon:yes gene_type:complete
MIDLGQVYGDAAQIQGARQRNELLEMMAPLKVEGAQLRNEAQGQQNRLADLTMDDQVQQTQQQTQMGDMKLTDADREQAAYESQLFLRTLGEDFDQLPPEQRNQRWSAARQRAIEMDPEDAVLPEQFDPNAYRNIAAMASMGGQGNTNVQSTFRTNDGKLGYVTRDGRTVVTDQQVEGKFQTERYGDQPYVFNPRSGQFLRVGGDVGQTAPSDANTARYADVGAAGATVEAQERARDRVNKDRQEPLARSKVRQQFSQIDSVMDNVDRAIGNVNWATAGAGGALTGFVPGTPARDLRATIDTIKANLGFDRLQQMRDQSPTGGALGQVSEMELRLLNSAIQNLDTDQSPEQLRQNLQQIRYHYDNFRGAIERSFEEQYGDRPGGQSAPASETPPQGGGQPSRLRYNPETGQLEPVR